MKSTVQPDICKNYLRHKDINNYLDKIQTKYPHLVKVKTVGNSYEGRPMKLIHISSNNDQPIPQNSGKIDSEKIKINKSAISMNRYRSKSFITNTSCNNVNINTKSSGTIKLTTKTETMVKTSDKISSIRKFVVLIDGGMHAREWISISTALYCIMQLTENYDVNKNLLRNYDFVIVPVVNIDGYEYTHTTNRMWRKSRRPINDSKYIGVDYNRNFSFRWNHANDDPASATFRGEAPFSEPETRIIKSLMHTLQPKFYLSLHSCAKSIMYPFGSTTKLPKNWQVLHDLANAGSKAIANKTGKQFEIGSVSTVLKRTASGGSADYAYITAKIPYAITMETAGGTFQPPCVHIKKLLEENWAGIQAMCSFLLFH